MIKIIAQFIYNDALFFVTNTGQVYRIIFSFDGVPMISQVDKLD